MHGGNNVKFMVFKFCVCLDSKMVSVIFAPDHTE
jgi:hypothetical protein